MENTKAIIIEMTRHALRGGKDTSRTLWATGKSIDDLQYEFNQAKEYCKRQMSIAWSVEIVDVKPDLPPSKW